MQNDEEIKPTWSDTFDPYLATIDIRNLYSAYNKARYFQDCTFEEFVAIIAVKSGSL